MSMLVAQGYIACTRYRSNADYGLLGELAKFQRVIAEKLGHEPPQLRVAQRAAGLYPLPPQAPRRLDLA